MSSKRGENGPVGVVLREGEVARRDEGGRVVVREGPVRVRVGLGGLVTGDGHVLEVGFGCAVVARPEGAERQMLGEALLSERTCATVGDVAKYMTGGLREAAGRAVGERDVAAWMGEGAREELTEVLRRAADAAGFAAGLEVLPPYQVEVESPSLRRMERERVEREMAEREQGERLSHLRRSAEVMREFEAIRAAMPAGVPVSAVVSRMAAGEQARVVQMLMGAGGKEEALYAVAGTALVRVGGEGPGHRVEVSGIGSMSGGGAEPSPRPSPGVPGEGGRGNDQVPMTNKAPMTNAQGGEGVRGGGAPLEEVRVTGDVGPFRSVQGVVVGGQRRVALGGRSGVVMVDPERVGAEEVYWARDVVSAMGFNRVVVWGGRVWASHSEAGLVGWDLGEYEKPAVRIGVEGTFGSPRHLVEAGGRLLFAAGGTVGVVDEGLGVREVVAGDGVVGLFVGERGVMVVRESGEVQVLDGGTLGEVRKERRAGRVCAAAVMPFYDSPRLVLAGEDGPVTCLSVEDPVVVQYPSAYRGMRALAASAGRVAGVSADRQRVVVFDASGVGAAREVHVGGRLRHRVADVAFVG